MSNGPFRDYAVEINGSMGAYGGRFVSNTAASTVPTGYKFNAIQAISDTVLTATGNIEGLSAKSIPAGCIVLGEFTSFTLTSGAVIGYYKPI